MFVVKERSHGGSRRRRTHRLQDLDFGRLRRKLALAIVVVVHHLGEEHQDVVREIPVGGARIESSALHLLVELHECVLIFRYDGDCF